MTENIGNTMEQLPVGGFCAINEGEEVMRVATHELSSNEKGVRTLTVSGDSFPFDFMQYRIALDTYEYYNNKKLDESGNIVDDGVHTWGIGNPSWNNADAAAYIIDQHLITGTYRFLDVFNAEALPNMVIRQTDPLARINYFTYLERGTLLTNVQKLLMAGGNGLRSKRAVGNSTDTEIIIYRGADRTARQGNLPPVIFREDEGHLINSKYLMSDKGYYNSYLTFPAKMKGYHHWEAGGSGLHPFERMGIHHRDLLVDATEITAENQAEANNGMNARIDAERAKYAPVYIMQCSVAENIPYVMGEHYNLGDLLTLVGDFGITKDARVDEYVMSEDKNGLRYSPGLTIYQ